MIFSDRGGISSLEWLLLASIVLAVVGAGLYAVLDATRVEGNQVRDSLNAMDVSP